MRNRMAPNIPLASVVFAAVAAVLLRAAARRPEPRQMPGAEPAPVTVTADESRPRPAVTACTWDGGGHTMIRPPGPPGRPESAVDQMQHVYHELHADARNALCAACDGRYGPV